VKKSHDGDQRKTRKNKILDEIADYLDQPFRTSPNGGWPEVAEEDKERLRKVIALLVHHVFDTDEDGDPVIDVRVHSRRDGYLPYVELVPHLAEDESNRLDVYQAASRNARITQAMLQSYEWIWLDLYAKHKAAEKAPEAKTEKDRD
jgi:hypothetical protein